MERASRESARSEAGFTLVELLVVVLILGVLVAIAVAGLISAQDNAKTKAATSNLRVALTSAKALQAEHESYLVTDAPTTITELSEAEPALTWQAAPATTPEQISVSNDDDTAGLATKSKDGFCYYIVDDIGSSTGGTKFGKSAAAATDCPAEVDTTVAGITWADSPKLAGW